MLGQDAWQGGRQPEEPHRVVVDRRNVERPVGYELVDCVLDSGIRKPDRAPRFRSAKPGGSESQPPPLTGKPRRPTAIDNAHVGVRPLKLQPGLELTGLVPSDGDEGDVVAL